MWYLSALIAMLCYACMQLLIKQLTAINVGSPVILMFIFGFGCMFYIAHVAVARPAIPSTALVFALLVAASLLSYIGNLFSIRALSEAPNPGYASAIIGAQALVITLVAVFLFGSEITWLKTLGVLFCVLGVILIVI